MVEKLFVYGTLAKGRPNEKVLEVVGGTWEEATITGRLLPEGWGESMGYSGLKLDAKTEKINGFVFTSDNFSNHWQRLDEFEGEEYCRVLSEVRLKSGALTSAYVYTLK